MTDTGFFDWGFSINFSGECLGQSDGAKQAANLGDGLGFSALFFLRTDFDMEADKRCVLSLHTCSQPNDSY